VIFHQRFSLLGRLGAIACVSFGSVVAQAADDEAKDKPRAAAQADDDVLIDTPRFNVAVPPPGPGMFRQKLPDYWLGLECLPAPPALLAQLKLPDEGAIVVGHVQPESPASKAGFKPHDVLISVGEAPLAHPKKILALLEESKGKELSFTLIRAGEKLTLTVTPEKRPAPAAGERDHVRWLQGNPRDTWEQVREQLEQAGVPIRMHFLHPGMVVPAGTSAADFPDDLHVHIHKHGTKPAEVVVERGDKKWTVTEDKLSELPEEVRGHVETLLGRMPMPNLDIAVENDGAITPPQDGFSERFEDRLLELNRRLDAMRDEINHFREWRKERREQKQNAPAEEKPKPADVQVEPK
jgi:hypothetical protein